jgi:hypothetical protein
MEAGALRTIIDKLIIKLIYRRLLHKTRATIRADNGVGNWNGFGA